MSDIIISLIGVIAMYVVFIVPIYFIINNIVNYILQSYGSEESILTNNIVFLVSICLVLTYVDVSYGTSNYEVAGKL